MNQHQIDKFEIKLLENGLDFILSALEYFGGSPSERDLKYGVLHLCSGVELVLKERLLREHWILVFEKPDQASKTALESGDFRSVRFDACIDRLAKICGIKWLENHKEEFRRFRSRRNRIEHFSITDSVAAIKSSASKILAITLDFINREFDDEISLMYQDELDEIRARLGDFEQFVKDRMTKIRDRLNSYSVVLTCPRCFQNTLAVEEGILCLFCGYKNIDPEQAANEYVSDIMGLSEYVIVKEGGEWPIYECPECWETSLVCNNDEELFLCFNCGKQWSEGMQFCESCGSPFIRHEGDSIICDTCIEHRMLD